MGTLLTLDPAGYGGFLQWWLNGEPAAGKTVIPVLYPNLPGTLNMLIGAYNLDIALHFVTPPITVVGHSEGAQVIYLWLQNYGPTSDVDPGAVNFISTGNPCRKYGGVPWASGIAIPPGCPYTVIDVARQYDGWADWPNKTSSHTPDAVENAVVGMFFVHTNYFNVSLTDPDNLTLPEGNTTYMWSRTDRLPLLFIRQIGSSVIESYPNGSRPGAILARLGGLHRNMGFTKWGVYPNKLQAPTHTPQLSGTATLVLETPDQKERPLIESCYDRPVDIPPPDYL